ncbi:MAG: rhomboid family intramembrane serine protease [Bacilli bacterium]|nr:rhomboid family intramembrane serine protease [Bacilli bacterium]MDD4809176.1 rhomboid family intramembrane serine protease [Bacilli bacterium]
MGSVVINKNEEIAIKLLHYFIVEQGYNPIVLHGVKDEIWLENLNGDYKVIRIVSGYIHNDEQFNFDLFKTKEIVKKIQRKTLSLNINTLNIFINLGDNVHLSNFNAIGNINSIHIKEEEDIDSCEVLVKEFPTITKKTNFKEKGMELFVKLTNDINQKGKDDAVRAEEVFSKKKPFITYLIIAINTVLFLAMYLFGKGSTDAYTLINFGASFPELIKAGEYYRLITSAFLHIGPLHFLVNNYALYVLGPQLESFFGKTKFTMIYLFSAITGNLLSMLFFEGISAGASGAIFGLLGALLYFGYHYRVYLDNVIKSQIIPIILINLIIGFSISGINNAAHIGGLFGGTIISIALGVKYKSTDFEKLNGWIITLILLGFLIYMAFII